MLHHVLDPELIIQIFASILLQRLKKDRQDQMETTNPFKNRSYLHVMINRLSKRNKIRMARIEDIKKTPAIVASKSSANELGWESFGRRGTTGSVLQHKLMARQRVAVDTITVGITVWGDQRVWKPQEGRGHGRGRGRTAGGRGRAIGQAIERFIVTVGL
jgi:hypothetical protein